MKQNNWTTSCTQNEAKCMWETMIWLESVTEKVTRNAQPGACVDVLPWCSWDPLPGRASYLKSRQKRWYTSSWIFDNVIAKWSFCIQQFFSKVAMTANFVRLVFKTLARFFQRILPIIFQSVPFRSDRHRFSPFGINAAHFVGSSSQIFDNIIAKWTFCIQQFFSAKNYHPK